MSYRRLRLVTLALVGVTLLSACGFRLAGTSELSPRLERIYLVTDNFDQRQQRDLSRSLEAAGAQIVTTPTPGAAQLNVNLRTVSDQQLATSASSGGIVKRITRGLDFGVKSSDGTVLLGQRTIRQQRDVSLDDDNLLSSNREREAVVRELEQALYDQLIRQLARI